MTLPLLFERDGPVATITFNRPERRNAICPETACRLADALLEAKEDSNIRAVILTGSGEQSFCAGGDLGLTLPLLSGAREPENEYDHRYLNDENIVDKIAMRGFEMNKPLIGAVNGPCMAAGMEILLATDIRYCVTNATFGLPEAARGVIPFAGALARLARQIPYTIAMEMMVANRTLDAQTAVHHGLVNKVVTSKDLLKTARETAFRIAECAPISVQQIKKTTLNSIGIPLTDGFALEDEAKAIVMATEDAREGPRAFIEKRPPVYKGH